MKHKKKITSTLLRRWTSAISTMRHKYKGRFVLRGDIVKDDSGAYAVFTEQGSSAWQMTAAKVMDVIARQPGCAGQAADAASTHTQVKLEDAPRLLKIPKVRMSRCMNTSSTTQVPKILVRHRRPGGSSRTKFVWHPLGNLTHKLSRGPTTWRDMRKSALRGIVNWQTTRRSNCPQFQRLTCMITTSRRRI